MTVNSNYALGDVPTYSQFYTSGNLPSSISGNVFIDGNYIAYSLSVSDQSHVDYSPGSSIYTYSLVANGSSQKSISFRGAGFGSLRVPWAGITLNASILNQSIINNCLITDANIYSTGIGVNAFISAGYPVPTITNNQFQNCTTDIQTINYGPSYLELGDYGSNTYSNFAVRGNWKVTTPSTFTVPSGATMTVTPVSTSYNQPSTIQFASG